MEITGNLEKANTVRGKVITLASMDAKAKILYEEMLLEPVGNFGGTFRGFANKLGVFTRAVWKAGMIGSYTYDPSPSHYNPREGRMTVSFLLDKEDDSGLDAIHCTWGQFTGGEK